MAAALEIRWDSGQVPDTTDCECDFSALGPQLCIPRPPGTAVETTLLLLLLPDKSEIAMHFAKHAAASALLNGWKSVELSQAYLLMSLYGVPARRWEEDRNWLYTGLAIRIATDLNLHVVSNVKPRTEKQEREMVNQTRAWLLCFNLDRSTAAQFGKPSTIRED